MAWALLILVQQSCQVIRFMMFAAQVDAEVKQLFAVEICWAVSARVELRAEKSQAASTFAESDVFCWWSEHEVETAGKIAGRKLLFNLDVFKQLVLLARAWHCLQTMPPRKKQRTLGGAAAAKSFASGSDTPLLATTVDALPKVQKDCLSMLDSIYGLRHCQESMVYTEPRGLLTPEPNGLFSFPVCWGGTFKDIAQRAWSEPDKLLQLSTQLAFDAGFLDEADEDEFLQQFCKLDVS